MADSVAGIVRRGKDLFIARRGEGGDLGGKWEFPGGKVEEGESDGEALIREFGEEFSAAVTVGPFLGSAVFEHRGAERTLRAYEVRFKKGDFILREHAEWRWADPEEIKALDFADSDRKLLDFIGRIAPEGPPSGEIP
ncbi:MAG: (deoxy)nucleoside triphosphate pyrophosphohydrolase [Treponema sp.]|jgi:8-oxo-dGTP diphosphatase|nr:(deoxy)nucleoside triphosphate pyrophosphohydrolase [Treponema sp.]